MSSNITGAVANTCEDKKMNVEKPITSITNASGDGVIVLNPVDDTVCNLQCAVGYYHKDDGNAAPFVCDPNTTDRTSRAGVAKNPITCTST